MCVEVVHDQNYFLGICIALFKHLFDEMSPVNSSPLFSNFHLTLSPKRFNFKEYACNPIANIFIIHQNRMARGRGNGVMHLSDQLLT